MSVSGRFRAWVFTLNNPSAEHEDDEPGLWAVEYIVYQLEQGESGTVHWQGYLTVKNPLRLNEVRNRFNVRAHWEPRKGTHAEAKTYCMKAEGRLDGPYEYGVEPCQGKRSDWSSILDLVKVRATDEEIMSQFPGHFARNYRGIERFRTVLLPKRDWPMEVVCYWGPPGIGKSRRAAEEAGRDAYWKDPGNKWFDLYRGEEVVVFDDFKSHWFTLGTLLRLMDRYPMKVESKGGSMEFGARKIIMTSQHHPSTWYHGERVTEWERAALLRRFTTIELMGPEEPGAPDGPPLQVGFANSPSLI